ncbi:hypothetical protein Ancab_018322 [Ancistrocladus abbreviatus]
MKAYIWCASRVGKYGHKEDGCSSGMELQAGIPESNGDSGKILGQHRCWRLRPPSALGCWSLKKRKERARSSVGIPSFVPPKRKVYRRDMLAVIRVLKAHVSRHKLGKAWMVSRGRSNNSGLVYMEITSWLCPINPSADHSLIMDLHLARAPWTTSRGPYLTLWAYLRGGITGELGITGRHLPSRRRHKINTGLGPQSSRPYKLATLMEVELRASRLKKVELYQTSLMVPRVHRDMVNTRSFPLGADKSGTGRG